MTHMQMANSSTMAILCTVTILIVLLQPVLFIMLALKRGKELEMSGEELKEAARLAREGIDPDLWERLLELCGYHTVHLHWVKGHADNEFNNRCDELAVAESQKFRK